MLRTYVMSAADLSVSTSADSWPDTIIMPWHTLNMDTDVVHSSRSALTSSLKKLANTVIPTNQSLYALAPENPDKPIMKPMLTPMLAGTRGDIPIVIQPVWTTLQGYQLFMLVVADSNDNTILVQTHYILPGPTWRDAQRRHTSDKLITDIVTNMWSELATKKFARHPPDLAIGLNSAVVSNRSNEIERNAANLLLAETLPSTYTVVNPFTFEQLLAVHRVWQKGNLFRKPNRQVITEWLADSNVYKKNLPTSMHLHISVTDGVFAQALPDRWDESVIFSLAGGNKVGMKISPRLVDVLKVENTALQRSENPSIAKIYGAWAYLDKGRAWGLQMNDRLVLSIDQQKIKGHIVGYFGPELKLKSPRGWPINEGAIMYVRKGQSAVQLGQEFAYDTMQVPTPWPPTTAVK